MTVKEQGQFQRKLEAIYQGAQVVKKSFLGRKVCYVTDHSTLEVVFQATNFMHLCGVHYKRGATLFFQDCLDRKLILADLLIKRDGTTFQKLQVVSSLDLLLTLAVSIVGKGQYARLRYDAAIRTRRKILALSLKETEGKYVPISLLNLQSKEIGSGDQIWCIYTEDFHTHERRILISEDSFHLE